MSFFLRPYKLVLGLKILGLKMGPKKSPHFENILEGVKTIKGFEPFCLSANT